MKKFFQVLKAIIISLLVLGAIAYVLCYIFLKEQTTYFTECLINFLQKPLPIVGISIIGLGYIVFKIFSLTKFGKRTLTKLAEENARLRQENEEHKEQVKELLNAFETRLIGLENGVSNVKEIVAEGYDLSHNIKIKALADKMRGVEDEETTNSDTKAEEI